MAAIVACAVAGAVLLACQPLLPRSASARASARASGPVPISSLAPTPLRVLVLGDSLSGEARVAATTTGVLAAHQLDWSGSLFGSAPCNGRATAARTDHRPDVVVIAYSGNSDGVVDNCMAGERGPELIARYSSDVAALIERFRDGHTRVVVVGPPFRSAMDADSDELFTALETVARSTGVAFVDGGRTITPGRIHQASLPCLPTERRCGTAGPGRNVVRNPDGIHFCPGTVEMVGRCSTYSSGAVRYAAAFADAIDAARRPR